MFDWSCGFIEDPAGNDALARSGVPIIALENARGAEDVFRYRPPEGRYAIVVGNERKGVSRELLRLAHRTIQIPIQSAQLNCLNVAAAAAVALYRLARRQGRQTATRGGRSGGRPVVVFGGVDDPIELGSAVRSAACFGWKEVCVADRHEVWFEADRVTRSLGRGAARRARNPIRVIPAPSGEVFDEICVIGTDGEPLRCTDLSRGPRQLLVLGDAGAVDHRQDGSRIRRIRLEVEPGRHPFRLVASIALAEVARQLGARVRAEN
ncbi:MAG: TrmH family RNA methyltransferase [Kofleriaceae bacterium]